MPGATPTALFFAIAVPALGCAPAGSTWTGTIEERDGAQRVTNPAEPLWPAEGGPYLRLELEQAFGVDEEPTEAILARVQDLEVDASGRVYVLDSADDRLVAFAPDGSVLWSAGRPGAGPGELEYPRASAIDGNALYVLDESGRRLEWWGIDDGAHLGQVGLEELGLDGAASVAQPSAGRLMFLEDTHGGQDRQVDVVEAAEGWPVLESFTIAVDGFAANVAQGEVAPAGDEILVGSPREHRFRVYRADGSLERLVARSQSGFLGPASDSASGVTAPMSWVHAPVRLPDRRLLVAADWPTNVPDPDARLRKALAGEDLPPRETRHVLDLFDPEGRWLTGLTWDHPDAPEHGRIRTLGPDGKLYTIVTDPFPQVRRYRVVIDEPSR